MFLVQSDKLCKLCLVAYKIFLPRTSRCEFSEAVDFRPVFWNSSLHHAVKPEMLNMVNIIALLHQFT